jgi:hypothetical protein
MKHILYIYLGLFFMQNLDHLFLRGHEEKPGSVKGMAASGSIIPRTILCIHFDLKNLRD